MGLQHGHLGARLDDDQIAGRERLRRRAGGDEYQLQRLVDGRAFGHAERDAVGHQRGVERQQRVFFLRIGLAEMLLQPRRRVIETGCQEDAFRLPAQPGNVGQSGLIVPVDEDRPVAVERGERRPGERGAIDLARCGERRRKLPVDDGPEIGPPPGLQAAMRQTGFGELGAGSFARRLQPRRRRQRLAEGLEIGRLRG